MSYGSEKFWNSAMSQKINLYRVFLFHIFNSSRLRWKLKLVLSVGVQHLHLLLQHVRLKYRLVPSLWHSSSMISVIGTIFKTAERQQQWMSFQFVNADYEHRASKASKGKNNKALSKEREGRREWQLCFAGLICRSMGWMDSDRRTKNLFAAALACTHTHTDVPHCAARFLVSTHTHRSHHALLSTNTLLSPSSALIAEQNSQTGRQARLGQLESIRVDVKQVDATLQVDQ